MCFYLELDYKLKKMIYFYGFKSELRLWQIHVARIIINETEFPCFLGKMLIF